MRSQIYILIILLVITVYCCKGGNQSFAISSIDSLAENANCFYWNDDYKNAIAAFDKYIEKDSSKGLIYYRRAYCKTQLSDYVGSINDLKKSIELNYSPDTSYYSIGLVYIALGNDSLALKYFYKSYGINNKNEKVKYETIHAKRNYI